MADYNPDDDAEMEKTVTDDEALSKVEAIEPVQSNVEAELKKAKDAYLYLAAEFDNYRKQMIKERSHLSKFGAERVLHDVVGVLDNFERALQSEVNEKNVETFKKGVALIAGEIRNLLTRSGVAEIPSEGVVFDPNVHEALTSEESADLPPGYITKVFRKAYKLHDRILRPGQVVVAREPVKEKQKSEIQPGVEVSVVDTVSLKAMDHDESQSDSELDTEEKDNKNEDSDF